MVHQRKVLRFIFIFIFILLMSFLIFKHVNAKENINNYKRKDFIEERLPVSDFENLYGFHYNLENSKQVQPTRNIAKLLFHELVNMQEHNNFAIDFTRKKMQKDASSLCLGGLKEFEIDLSEQDIETLYKLLEKSHIMNWKTTYDDAEPGLKASGNGYIWKLAIQYNDGTAWYYSGETTPKEPYLPEGYDILVKGLNELAESKKQ
ncbi:hypothetical protein HYE66_02760 [Aggregatibacter actinomycetemcomitans]|nr:hypothetical protein [Aggregatibacter actinomycetemcomitans]